MNRLLPSKTFCFSVLLLMALISSLYFTFKTANSIHFNTVPSYNNNSPDSYMDDLRYQSFTETGEKKSRLLSPSAIHYPKEDLTTFTKPQYIFYRDQQIEWIITADNGKSYQNHQTIFLEHHVLIHQPQTANTLDTKIYIEHLTITPATNTATSSDPVLIKRPGTVIRGIGLIANLKTGEYQLLKAARGIYEPNA